MTNKTINLKQPDGFTIKMFFYPTDITPIGTIILLTGMCEHHKRYESFISILNDNGFDVITYDHRGQGSDYSVKDLGFVAEKSGQYLLINDALAVTKYAIENTRVAHVFIIGHSMGSIISRIVISHNLELNGAAILSTAYASPAIYSLGKKIIGFTLLFKDGHNKAQLFTKKVFGSKQYNSFGNRTSFDWISRDINVVGNYIHDPYCGYTCTISFYHDLASLSKIAASKKTIQSTSKNLPILLAGGSKDPVGDMGNAPKKLYELYTSNGNKNVKKIIYKDCRHELLNELNRDDIIDDILSWLNSLL